MSKLLLDKHPLVIIPDLAVAVGLNESIILQQVHYWVEINTKSKRNFKDGHYWTYNTFEEWQAQFPFWSVRTIKRVVKILENKGLLISGNFNTIKQDRTKWYRIDHEALGIVTTCHFALCQYDPTITRDYPEINHSIISSSPSSKKIAASSKSALPKTEKGKVEIIEEKVLEPVY